jgi:hypothetical protein
MSEVTLNLNGDQVEIVRRAVAEAAENTAKAGAMHVGTMIEGHFPEDRAAANRAGLAYCMKMLRAEIAILEPLPWSSEEEANRGLLPEVNAAQVLAVVAEEGR